MPLPQGLQTQRARLAYIASPDLCLLLRLTGLQGFARINLQSPIHDFVRTLLMTIFKAEKALVMLHLINRIATLHTPV